MHVRDSGEPRSPFGPSSWSPCLLEPWGDLGIVLDPLRDPPNQTQPWDGLIRDSLRGASVILCPWVQTAPAHPGHPGGWDSPYPSRSTVQTEPGLAPLSGRARPHPRISGSGCPTHTVGINLVRTGKPPRSSRSARRVSLQGATPTHDSSKEPHDPLDWGPTLLVVRGSQGLLGTPRTMGFPIGPGLVGVL